MTNKSLFLLWGGLFALCAGLGFLPEPNGFTTLAALSFFVPPAVLLYRAKKAGDSHTVTLIRSLSALSLGLTAVLLVLNFLTALRSELLGTVIHYVLVTVSSPMICSGHWALSLFLWACLLTISVKLLKK